MINKIEPYIFTVKDIFKDKWFNIPPYQRPYAWKKDEVDTLLNNIYEELDTNTNEYFIGSTIWSKTEDSKIEDKEYDIIDGQQRLTTLLLIIATIKNISENKQCQKACETCILQEANPFAGTPNKSRISFAIREETTGHFLKKYIETENAIKDNIEDLKNIQNIKNKSISEKNMANAIITIADFFSKDGSEYDQEKIEKFTIFLMQNVKIVSIITNNFDNALRLFSVMNSTGSPLKNSDIIKSYNLAKISKAKEETYARKWEEVESYLEDDFDNFLEQLRGILVKEKAKFVLMKEYKENIYNKKKLQEGEQGIDFIYNHYQNYQDLFDNSDVKNQLELMKYSGGNYWLAPLLSYYDKFKTKNLDYFITKLDRKFSSDWIVGFTPTQRMTNMYEIIKKIESFIDSEDVINAEVIFDNQANNTINIKNQLAGDVYKERYAKYLLLKLSLNSTEKGGFKPSGTISIEHILPQNPKKDSQWNKDFSEQDKNNYLHKIGNLMLLSGRKNASLGNKDYVDKKREYYNKKIDIFPLSLNITQSNEEWKLQNLKDNHKKQLKILLEKYDIQIDDASLEELIINNEK
jgi:uncharacterized protein with ParB-like and HNH nuclease domain